MAEHSSCGLAGWFGYRWSFDIGFRNSGGSRLANLDLPDCWAGDHLSGYADG